jgi:hypothetical protein
MPSINYKKEILILLSRCWFPVLRSTSTLVNFPAPLLKIRQNKNGAYCIKWVLVPQSTFFSVFFSEQSLFIVWKRNGKIKEEKPSIFFFLLRKWKKGTAILAYIESFSSSFSIKWTIWIIAVHSGAWNFSFLRKRWREYHEHRS